MDILVIAVIILLIIFSFLVGRMWGARKKYGEIEENRADAVNRSRAVLGGQFSENLAPYLPNFPFSPTECRFIGKPVDFVVFEGMDEKKIERVTFVEVKSGDSQLSSQEKNLKDTIEKGKVDFYEYRVDKDITR